jgi:hypothetical protein
MLIVVRSLYDDFMSANSVLSFVQFISGQSDRLSRTECWIEIWNASDKPVLSSFAVGVLSLSYTSIGGKVKKNCRWSHLFISRAKWASFGMDSFVLSSWEICWSFCSFGCYDYPAVQQIVFPDFIRHLLLRKYAEAFVSLYLSVADFEEISADNK